jgi:hypothetical protein
MMADAMNGIIERLRRQACEIAARQPEADFYRDFRNEVAESAAYFQMDPAVDQLKTSVADAIENDFGHGMAHARKVAVDAGALVAIEGRAAAFSAEAVAHEIRMAHCAGLLHDIRRKQKDHARQGAIYARQILADYPFSEKEISDICVAIANHEAFGEYMEMPTAACRILSDCLYDSDKFRFGPDNFTQTVWDMVAASNISPERFMALYPKGLDFLRKIKRTFRSPTGRRYGPQFIDIGLAIGEELYACMKTEMGL